MKMKGLIKKIKSLIKKISLKIKIIRVLLHASSHDSSASKHPKIFSKFISKEETESSYSKTEKAVNQQIYRHSHKCYNLMKEYLRFHLSSFRINVRTVKQLDNIMDSKYKN